jgi:hypothetical protein
MAPAFGVALTDLDGDGETDAVLAQNFFSPQPENGQLDSGLSVFLRGNPDGSFQSVEPAVSGISVPGDAKGVSIADVNGDQLPDVVIGVNQGKMRVFTNRAAAGRRLLGIRLKGETGNPGAAGARITVRTPKPQTSEVSAGSGYLSQSSGTQWFGMGETSGPVEVEVRWPDGEVTRRQVNAHGVVEVEK